MTNSRVLNIEYWQMALVQEYLLHAFSRQVLEQKKSFMDL